MEFGVRRQSEAATALLIDCAKRSPETNRERKVELQKPIQSAVAASLCRRTPNLIVIN